MFRRTNVAIAFAISLVLGGIAATSAHAYIYWANLDSPGSTGTTIGRVGLDASGLNANFIGGAQGPCGVAVSSQFIFWQNSNTPGQSIGRANLDGSNPLPDLISIGTPSCGVAVNSTQVFWARNGVIGRASFDGSGIQDSFITTNPGNNCGVAANDTHVYWLESSGQEVRRTTINTPGAPEIIATTNPNSCGLALNSTHVFWGNGTAIGRANLDGSGLDEPAFIPGAGGNPSTPALSSTHVYWANSAASSIGRANLDGTGVNQAYVSLPGDDPVGVAVDDGVDADPVPPSNEFSFGKLKRNRKKGTAKLTVNVPGPGELALSGAGLASQRLAGGRSAKPVAAAGAVKLLIKPKGKKKKKLKKKGKVKAKAKVTFTPTGGTAATQTKSLKLKRKRS